MSQPKQANQETVEFPSLISTANEIDAIDRLLKAKRDELRGVEIQYMHLTGQISKERYEHETFIANSKIQMRQMIAAKMAEVDQIRSEAEQKEREMNHSLERQMEAELIAQKAAQTANEQRQVLSNLNRERMEIAVMRREAQTMKDEAQSVISQSQHNLNIANLRLEEANRKIAEVETRTQKLGQLSDELKEQQKKLELETKHYELVKQEAEERLEQLSKAMAKSIKQEQPSESLDTSIPALSTPKKEK